MPGFTTPEVAARAMATRGHAVGSEDAARLAQMRRLIDSANVAVMRGFTSKDVRWLTGPRSLLFEICTHQELPCRKWQQE